MTLNDLISQLTKIMVDNPDKLNTPVLIRDGNNGMTLDGGSVYFQTVDLDNEEGGPILDMKDGQEYIEIYGD